MEKVKVVVTGSQSSGTKRIIVEGEVVESLPSRGLFGYSPPAVTKNPKSVKFGFEGASRDLACYFSVKEISDGEIDIFLNEQSYAYIPASEDWTGWYLILDRADLRTGTNTIEFRNMFNQNRTSGFARWQLKDVSVGEPPSAKPRRRDADSSQGAGCPSLRPRRSFSHAVQRRSDHSLCSGRGRSCATYRL